MSILHHGFDGHESPLPLVSATIAGSGAGNSPGTAYGLSVCSDRVAAIAGTGADRVARVATRAGITAIGAQSAPAAISAIEPGVR